MTPSPTYRRKVEEISEVIESIGNEWEIDFTDNVSQWEREFTEKQKETIDHLYQKACDSEF